MISANSLSHLSSCFGVQTLELTNGPSCVCVCILTWTGGLRGLRGLRAALSIHANDALEKPEAASFDIKPSVSPCAVMVFCSHAFSLKSLKTHLGQFPNTHCILVPAAHVPVRKCVFSCVRREIPAFCTESWSRVGGKGPELDALDALVLHGTTASMPHSVSPLVAGVDPRAGDGLASSSGRKAHLDMHQKELIVYLYIIYIYILSPKRLADEN